MTKFYFQNPTLDPLYYCCICGERGSVGTTKHNQALHEVWAYTNYGMDAVIYPARPFVQAWAETGQLPTNDEFQALAGREVSV